MEVIVESDYDGYFERLVRTWIAAVPNPRHKKVVVAAKPWQPDALVYSSDGETIRLCFYSALRAGFGQLSSADVEAVKQLL